MFRGQSSRCLISTVVPERRYGSSVSRTSSSNWSVPNGLRKQMRVTAASRSVGVSAVVVGGDGGLERASGKTVGGEGLQEGVAAETGDLPREQLGGERSQEDAAAAPAVEGIEPSGPAVLADERAPVGRRVV